MILPISDLKDRVEILLIKCRGLIKLDKAQMRLTFRVRWSLIGTLCKSYIKKN